MHHLIKIFVIMAVFAPLMYFSAYMLGAHRYQVDVLSLPLSEQMVLMALLLLPAFAMRYLRLLSTPTSTPHPME
ncbi:MAG: hypothetical protein IV108_00875 [Burkholderiales bacterium]|nr:hypothetical protein [Burkholderiales bacterium]